MNRACHRSEQANTVTAIRRLSPATNRMRNTPASISDLFRSSIGPKTRKVSSGPAVNMELNQAAMNASDVEQSEIRYAKPIMNRWEPAPSGTADASQSRPIPL